MYSKLNVDVSLKTTESETVRILGYNSGRNNFYKILPIIRGSSTVNGDSAHDTDPLAKEHNYVSFYVKRIELKCNFARMESQTKTPSIYVVLFKVPYISEDKLFPLQNNDPLSKFLLYSNPECVLCYDCVHSYTSNLVSSGKANYDLQLVCNKRFIVGPTDYVGVCYFGPKSLYNLPEYLNYSTAEVTFKPI